MTEQCPYLEHRPLSDEGGGSGDSGVEDREADDSAARAYCTAAEEFVQAMRADICNDRYDLDHETDCEIYRDREGLPEVPGSDPGAESDPEAESDPADWSTGTGDAGGD